jgi:predicted phosphodiesterase
MRILHVSDLHTSHGQDFDQARKTFKSLHPDLILITGDLTEYGYEKQFKIVEKFLDSLDFCEVLVIPGNRDLKQFKSREKYEKHISPDLDLFYRDSSKGIAVVGLNSMHDQMPKITHRQIEAMKLHFGEGAADEVRIFCAHHSFLPVPTKKLKPDHIVPQAGDILQALRELNVDILCSGHIHHAHVWSISGLVCCSAGLLFAASDQKEKDGFLDIKIGPEMRILKRSLDQAPPEVLYHDANFRRIRASGVISQLKALVQSWW